MRIVLVLLLICLGTRAYGVEVDGYDVKIIKPALAGGDVVALTFKLYEIEVGPDKGLAASGYAVSRLPSEWYNVTITIRFWDVYAKRKDVFERARAIIVLDKPKPGCKVKWRAILWPPKGPGRMKPFVNPRPIYTITTEFEQATALANPKGF